MTRRRLPIGGVQVFSELRREYDVYVDKTRHVYEMASRYKTVFLARPRRFGKSLLCSTIASLFRAEKELFEGLAIAGMDWEWKVHPIIHIGFGHGDFTDNGVEALNIIIERELDGVCDAYGISVKKTGDISDLFVRVITELAQKIGMPVVIIDEYDNPLLNTIDQPELNKRLREKLKGFYSVIKQYG
ncbi:MAG: AAA family ATPase, partial [Chitinispirillales bacterium]|nr:AAA family ATPase [Chitinispirillales bacterium]